MRIECPRRGIEAPAVFRGTEPFGKYLYLLCRHKTLCQQHLAVALIVLCYIDNNLCMSRKSALYNHVSGLYILRPTATYGRQFFAERCRSGILKHDIKVISECFIGVVFLLSLYPRVAITYAISLFCSLYAIFAQRYENRCKKNNKQIG